MARKFLTRTEAQRVLGFQHASRKHVMGQAKVACRHRKTGEVYEARDSETVHYMIMDRVGDYVNLEEGFTVEVS
jgi:hypothetical protein